MATSDAQKTRIITLSNRPPVQIDEAQWPVIAHGRYCDHDNQYEFQANRTWRCDIRVRQHADGRAIVYGVYQYSTQFQGERDVTAKCGEVVEPGDDLVAAIRSVAAELRDRVGGEDADYVRQAENECVASLPAVQL